MAVYITETKARPLTPDLQREAKLLSVFTLAWKKKDLLEVEFDRKQMH